MSTSEYLKFVFLNEEIKVNEQDVIAHKTRILPFGKSEIYFAPIQNAQKLTHGDDVKSVYQFSLNTDGVNYNFYPGDTIGVIPANNKDVVNALIQRLNLKNADTPGRIEIDRNTSKKNPSIPKHLPNCETTIRNIFLYNVDIQTPPKKLFLKTLSKFTSTTEEKEYLEIISSPKGSTGYNDLITKEGKTLLGLLERFPSCSPPVETLLEHLPPLQPRSYSISSSPLQKNQLEITFFLLEKDNGQQGLCTSWLVEQKPMNNSIPFYFRQPNQFQLPQNSKLPLILICAGTGIAPFRGFLQHRFLQIQNGHLKVQENRIWLFFGCRYKSRDYLYGNELEKYLTDGILTRLDVAFSRDCKEKVYVQDKIKESSKELISWIVDQNATIFVCGDNKTLVKGVEECLCDVFSKFGLDDSYFKELKSTGRYIVDTWS